MNFAGILSEGMSELLYPKDDLLVLDGMLHIVSRMIFAGSIRAALRAGIKLAVITTRMAIPAAHK